MEVKEKGISIKYRLCNIPEKLELLGALGMKPGESDVNYDYMFLAKGIKHITPFIQEVSVKHEGKVIKDWEKLLEIEEMTPHVIEIFTNILNPPKDVKVKK